MSRLQACWHAGLEWLLVNCLVSKQALYREPGTRPISPSPHNPCTELQRAVLQVAAVLLRWVPKPPAQRWGQTRGCRCR